MLSMNTKLLIAISVVVLAVVVIVNVSQIGAVSEECLKHKVAKLDFKNQYEAFRTVFWEQSDSWTEEKKTIMWDKVIELHENYLYHGELYLECSK